MILKFQNKENKLIGINPEQVVSVDPFDDEPTSVPYAVIHLADGQQRTVVGSVAENVNGLNLNWPQFDVRKV